MPELPEVETIRRQLCAAGIEGRIIEKVHLEWPRTVEPLTPDAFCKEVKGRKIEKIDRHGKWLIFVLGRDRSPNGSPVLLGVKERTARRSVPTNLLVHLRMTGGFYLTHGALEKGKHDRAILQLSGGLNLHFRDPRKFGRWRLESHIVGRASRIRERVPGDEHKLSEYREACPAIEGLGPDALTVTKAEFFRALPALSDAKGGVERGRSNKTLKALLLDQSFVAGVGNIYADEALFAARLDPRRKSGTLSDAEKLALWKAVRHVIEAGVRNKGTSLGSGQGNYVDLNGE
ncbi:MAG TPA: DNA-formamidopyrimidine glycosylase family protein, partial [Pontiellaceae bacterium]|nr:DNA-formamidopyrimidine glycosylase family protein [Pontiellaceae bacterium]